MRLGKAMGVAGWHDSFRTRVIQLDGIKRGV
jgi:hypothetical protein